VSSGLRDHCGQCGSRQGADSILPLFARRFSRPLSDVWPQSISATRDCLRTLRLRSIVGACCFTRGVFPDRRVGSERVMGYGAWW